MSTSISPQQNRNELSEQYLAQKSEREQLQKEHEAAMENLKKSYNLEKADLEDRFESSAQADKLAHYDHLRNTKTQMNREELRLDQTKNAVLSQKQDEFKKEEIQTDQDGRAHLQNVIKQLTASEEYERNRAMSAQQQAKNTTQMNTELILKDSDKKIATLREQKEQFLETAKDSHAQAMNEIQTHYDGLRTQVQTQYGNEVKTLKHTAAEDLNNQKLTNAAWIEQYANRARDPFYRISRYDSQVKDTGEAYVLRVKVPPYERSQFRVQLSGQEMQIVGVRTNSEKAEVEPGRWVTTSSHQNVSERFKLDVPVDVRAMTMEEEGDYLVYTIPKFGAKHRMEDAAQAQKVEHSERELIAELDFPNSLPKPTIHMDQSGKGPLSKSQTEKS